MRLSLSAWARRTSASNLGESQPFLTKYWAVQSSKDPTVHSVSGCMKVLLEKGQVSFAC